MAKINVFYVLSALGTLALISYLWLAFLPLFAGSDEYIGVRNLTVLISLMLAIIIIFSFVMAKRHPE